MTDLFGGELDAPSGRQNASHEKKKAAPSRPKKNSAAPVPAANRFASLKQRDAQAPVDRVQVKSGEISADSAQVKSGEISADSTESTRPKIPLPPPPPVQVKSQEFSAIIPHSIPLDNPAGELQKAIDTFRLFGMLEED